MFEDTILRSTYRDHGDTFGNTQLSTRLRLWLETRSISWCLTRSFEKGDVCPSLLPLSDGLSCSKHNLNFAVTHLKIILSMNCVFILFILFSHSRIVYYYNHYRIYEPPKSLTIVR